MIIHANTNTREILGYINIGSAPDTDANTTVFEWFGVTPEPPSRYLLGTDNRSVVSKAQAVLDSERDVRLWQVVRDDRNRRLQRTDGLAARQAEQSTLSVTDWNALKQYRQDLRDVPEDNSDPSNITWPTWPL